VIAVLAALDRPVMIANSSLVDALIPVGYCGAQLVVPCPEVPCAP
jgi:hypothetical protein